MKRANLTIGQELYYSRVKNWENSSYNGRRVVVVAVEPYAAPRNTWALNFDPYPIEKGNGVLVDMQYNNGTVSRRVVPLGHLRGPYAECAAIAEAGDRERQDQQQEAHDARQAARQAATLAVERAVHAGYPTVQVERTWPTPRVVLSVQDFARLLDVAGVPNQTRTLGVPR